MESFVTLATNTNYVLGALTLAQSLRKVNTTKQLTILITKEVGSQEALVLQLRRVFDHVELVDLLDSQDAANLDLLRRPELGVTFTKLHCWRLTQFAKCVFLDADCLCVQNVDDLFLRDEFSAATDIGWPDCFNSGVFVFKPSMDTYRSLLAFAIQTGSFDGGDQGLLNSYFSSWSTDESSRRLPFVYNMTTNVTYSYAPAFKQFRAQVKIVHFIGAQKPWYYSYNTDQSRVCGGGGNVQDGQSEHLTQWWSLFVERVLNDLPSQTKTLVNSQIISSSGGREGNGAQSSSQQGGGGGGGSTGFHQQSGSTTTTTTTQNQQGGGDDHRQGGQHQQQDSGVVVGSNQHQNLWESGSIEYQGRDSFENIQAHLDSQLKK